MHEVTHGYEWGPLQGPKAAQGKGGTLAPLAKARGAPPGVSSKAIGSRKQDAACALINPFPVLLSRAGRSQALQRCVAGGEGFCPTQSADHGQLTSNVS